MALPWVPIAQVAGQLIGAGLNSRNERKIREQNERLAREQREWNEEQWHRQNAYNTPENQMNRFQMAGLNPHLIYGGGVSGAAGNADAVAGYNRAEMKAQMDGQRTFSEIAGNIGTAIDQQIKAKQMENISQDSALKAAQTLKTATETNRSDFDLGISKELRETSITAAIANMNKAVSEADRARSEATVSSATIEPRIKQEVAKLQSVLKDVEAKNFDNVVKAWAARLAKRGININDPMWMRQIAKDVEDRGMLQKIINALGLNRAYLNPLK